jgi:hypothetical protein
LQKVVDAMERAENTPLGEWVHVGPQGAQARPLSLVLYCRSGKHRSVAVATGLQRVFHLRGYHVKVWHMESMHLNGWQGLDCGYVDGKCWDCPHEQREPALRAFVQQWYALVPRVRPAAT